MPLAAHVTTCNWPNEPSKPNSDKYQPVTHYRMSHRLLLPQHPNRHTTGSHHPRSVEHSPAPARPADLMAFLADLDNRLGMYRIDICRFEIEVARAIDGRKDLEPRGAHTGRHERL
jgi:hypothetical protein